MKVCKRERENAVSLVVLCASTLRGVLSADFSLAVFKRDVNNAKALIF